MTSKILATIFSATALVASIASPASAAATASYSIQANASAYTTGSNVSIQVTENGTDTKIVKVVMTYDPSKLSCAGFGASASFPSSTPSETCGNGTAVISRGGPNGVTGSVSAGTVNFTAISAGSTTVSVTGGSAIYGTDSWNSVPSSTSFTISAPAAPAPTPTPTPTPTPSTGGGSTKPSTTGSATTTTPSANSTTSTPQVEGASTTTPSDDTKAIEDTKTDGSTAAIRAAQDAANKDNNSAAWTIGSVVVVLGLLAAVYFYLTRRNPALLKSVAKKINL